MAAYIPILSVIADYQTKRSPSRPVQPLFSLEPCRICAMVVPLVRYLVYRLCTVSLSTPRSQTLVYRPPSAAIVFSTPDIPDFDPEFLASIGIRTVYLSTRRPRLVKFVPQERKPRSGLETLRSQAFAELPLHRPGTRRSFRHT